ncbi:SIR2 family NAD-dependent protein deacylase [Plebeiibacterium marinum]|uniref:protein acetyllysine N-acetyltransferase n=1 Tax=Plebeiibacterium marinum TaxID=2992111 RepID=A0AAE3MC04_9BACT|nr:NAD-dependent deacylase [Plebeiobacterium marinum]MCW3804928.1 NAD-dependent deacylase [Plebeiobacterium marinum]
MIKKAADIIKNSSNCIAFTGAGISVESGIPPFRGESGIWNRYDPELLDLGYFHSRPAKSWEAIREIFYDFFTEARPNDAHLVLAKLEEKGVLKAVVTQNIDNLHFEAGSKEVYEFHGNSQQLKCIKCGSMYPAKEVNLKMIPPKCKKCGGVLKPDFIFFGEEIPPVAYSKSFDAARKADVVIVIGSTGEVMPACNVPFEAKRNGAVIIEVNPGESNFTHQITDVHIKMNAGEAMRCIGELVIGH